MIHIDKNEFIEICKRCSTMSEASRRLKLHFNTFKKYAIQFGCYVPNQGGKNQQGKSSNKKINLHEILEGKYPDYQSSKLKFRLLNEGIKKHQCECCGLSTWNNLPIPLELHHKDGNRNNHKLENLQLLCPNCHAQTSTFRAKNINKAM